MPSSEKASLQLLDNLTCEALLQLVLIKAVQGKEEKMNGLKAGGDKLSLYSTKAIVSIEWPVRWQERYLLGYPHRQQKLKETVGAGSQYARSKSTEEDPALELCWAY